MKLAANKLPIVSIKNANRAKNNSFSVPFSKVKQEMGEFKYNTNTESSEMWKRNKSEDYYVPKGLKSYDPVEMKEINRQKKYKEDEFKHKYMKVISNNPYVFYRREGEFTSFIDSSIKTKKIGPFNKKLAKKS